MRILIVSQYFWPESFRINDLASSLSARGISVTVLTGKPNYPDGLIFPGYRIGGFLNESWKNVEVIRVPLFPRGKKSALGLILNYISFIFSASLFGFWLLRKRSFDIVFVYGTSPLLQALPAILLAKIKSLPLILNVQDLWPDSLNATGYVRSKALIGVVNVLVKFIYQQTDLILASSRPFLDSIESYSPKSRVVYYPNSVESFFCSPDVGLKCEVSALDSGFCVVFAGNVGSAQAVHVIIEAAELLKHVQDIRFVILGSGSELEWMRAQVKERGLSNVYLAGRYPVEAMPYLLSRASALLVTLADREIFAATVPNKIQAYMAVGRPIIACLNGEGARLVEDARAGIAVPAEDVTALAAAILRLHATSCHDRRQMGANAREYYRQHFDHEDLVTKLISHMSSVKRIN